MEKFKMVVSSHSFIPVKMIVILYFIWWGYTKFNDEKFEIWNNAFLTVGILIFYTLIRLLASHLPFFQMNDTDVYMVNNKVNEKIENTLKKFIWYEDKIGVFEETWVQKDNTFEKVYVPIKNPLELYYILDAYQQILATMGSYSSMQIKNKLDLFKQKLVENIELSDLNQQFYSVK